MYLPPVRRAERERVHLLVMYTLQIMLVTVLQDPHGWSHLSQGVSMEGKGPS